MTLLLGLDGVGIATGAIPLCVDLGAMSVSSADSLSLVALAASALVLSSAAATSLTLTAASADSLTLTPASADSLTMEGC